MYNSIYEEPWWLDAVAPGQWGETLVHRGDEVAARLAWVSRRAPGVHVLTVPLLCKTLGPWFRPTAAKYANVLAEQKDLVDELLAALPRYDFLQAQSHPSLANWLPFYWRGFTATPLYTYVIADTADTEQVWGEFTDSTRRAVRKAERSIRVRTDAEIDVLLRMMDQTYARQGLAAKVTEPLVRRLDAACLSRDRRTLYVAEDEQGRMHSALYAVRDARTCYYLMGGGDPELRSSGAMSLLMWTAIRDASARGLRFDFEGSMNEAIERFFRGFGARQAQYFRLRHAATARGRAVQWVYERR